MNTVSTDVIQMDISTSTDVYTTDTAITAVLKMNSSSTAEVLDSTSFDEGFEMSSSLSNSISPSGVADGRLTLVTYIIYISFSTMGILGNGLVLYVIARVKELHDTTNLFIVNQSLIDGLGSILLLGNFVLPKPSVPKGNIVLARFLCGFWYTQYPYWATYVATLVNLMILTLERYFAVVYPIRYRRYNSGKVVLLGFLVPWILGLLQQFYLILISRVEGGYCFIFQWPNDIMQSAMGIYTFVMYFVVTFAFMAFMYVRIYQTLRNGPKVGIGSANVHQTKDFRELARRNVVKTMMILSICYSTCLAPGQFAYLVYCFGVNVDLEGTFFYMTVCIAFICVWINPFVYTFQYHKFQNGLKVVFGCGRPVKSRQTQAVNAISAPKNPV